MSENVFTFQNEGRCFRHKPGRSASRARLPSASPQLSVTHSYHMNVRTGRFKTILIIFLCEHQCSHQCGSDSHTLSCFKGQVQVFCLGKHVGSRFYDNFKLIQQF